MIHRFCVRSLSSAVLMSVVFGVFSAAPVLSQTPPPAEAAVETGAEAQGTASPSVEKEKTLLGAIARRQKELDEREAAIIIEENRLLEIKKDIDRRIEELDRVLKKIEEFVSKIDEISDERVKRVAKIYSSMSPEEAAARIEKIDEKTAVMILATINEKQAAKILSYVNVDKSVKLSEALKIRKVKIEP